MTEDEAKTKWCPQARVPLAGGDCARNRGVHDRKVYIPEGALCIASACMAWRSTSSQHGYCGLAGRPRV